MNDQEFAAWLAGFIDGEGSFSIAPDRRDDSFRCSFKLKLRADDRAVLEQVQSRLRIGSVSREKRRPPSRPCYAWRVSSQADCQALIALLDAAPLQSKKRRDYEIWREAVALWVSRERRRGSRAGPATSGDDWSGMARLYVRLREVRAYVE